MTKRFISGTAVALTAAVMLVSGCGGGGGDTTETAAQAKAHVTKVVLKPQAPLSRARFIGRADPVCARSYEERGDILFKYARRAASLSQSEKEKVIAETILPLFRHELETLEALAKHSAPKGDEAKLEALLEAYGAALAEAEEDPGLVLANAPKQFAEVTKLARDYGFESCGSF